MKHLLALLALALLLLLASCASPPQAEIDAARAALQAAAANADVVPYAPDALRAAQQRLAALETEIAAQAKRSAFSRTYESAKSLALETVKDAEKSTADAMAAKEAAARDAQALADELTTLIPVFETKVWAARRVPRIKMEIITPIGLVPAAARAAVEDARADMSAGAFAAAKAKLLAVKDLLAGSEETITEQTRIARGR
jgi:hypothetical protein